MRVRGRAASRLAMAGLMSAVLALAGLAVAGCSGGGGSASASSSVSSSRTNGDTASVVIPKMLAATKAATSVHVAGWTGSGAKHFTINANVFRSGDAAGSIAENGATVSIILLDGTVYAKVTSQSLQIEGLPAAECAVMCGKYLRLLPSDGTNLASDLSMSGLLDTAGMSGLFRGDSAGLFLPGTYHSLKVLTFNDGVRACARRACLGVAVSRAFLLPGTLFAAVLEVELGSGSGSATSRGRRQPEPALTIRRASRRPPASDRALTYL